MIMAMRTKVLGQGEKSLEAGFHTRGFLPHIKKEGASYFVTFRLAGTLPQNVLLQFKTELEQSLPAPWPPAARSRGTSRRNFSDGIQYGSTNILTVVRVSVG